MHAHTLSRDGLHQRRALRPYQHRQPTRQGARWAAYLSGLEHRGSNVGDL